MRVGSWMGMCVTGTSEKQFLPLRGRMTTQNDCGNKVETNCNSKDNYNDDCEDKCWGSSLRSE
ncbi:hypothetical protein GCM10011507_03330 [Edaphobacter acidisoli]|uniref:Uncharacterized protein n=1 Tax=Edaphobacter acidisoli TaxID=2040573 RepID=A0A916VZG1_9BACT|nr:hypothetical protein GCM10011507_03330 [Edaphobacter acidisoli]